MSKGKSIRHIGLLTPTFGILSFAALYFVATLNYPGGSQFHKYAEGFNWSENYWCNLLYDNAINGEKNSAKPIALIAMMVLGFTLSYFWIQFPKYTSLEKTYKYTIQVSGILAIGIGFFLFTSFDHDITAYLASVAGLVAMIGTSIGLHKNGWKLLFYFGLLNTVLIILNYLLYNNEQLIVYLPMVQKITFATFLIWVGGIDIKIFNLVRGRDH